MACSHISSIELRAPKPNESVYREDCTQCFGSIDDPAGLDVCLHCFNGGCENHAPLHHKSTGHTLVVNIQRTRKPVKRDEPPQKMTKLAIAAESEEDRYDTKTSVRCYDCKASNIDVPEGYVRQAVEEILKAPTFARQAEVEAWEQDITPCEHTLTLQQGEPRKIASQDLGQCSKCELKENLWLCLTCGNLACGRSQVGGLKGNGHALEHGDGEGHPVAVKLGSITSNGTADIYCYKCNDERIDPDLSTHLANWGINIAEREKTEKSLTEMNIEENLKWDFSMTTEDGKELEPVFGKGLTGLKNLGNSCYLASTFQCLFSLPEFQERYFHPNEPPVSTQNPAGDLETQLRKLADGLLSGRFSQPDSDAQASLQAEEVVHQRGLAPAMLKHLIGQGHEEFSTMRQQDAFEFLLHVFKLITRSSHPAPLGDPTKSFQFATEQRLQCQNCKKVRYKVDEQDNVTVPVPVRRIPSQENAFEEIPLKECLDTFTGKETVELTCPACGSSAGFTKETLFKTFPRVLAMNARRFELVNWVPTKLDIPVIVNDQPFDLDQYLSKGQQGGEELLPDDEQSNAFKPNETALAQLEGMGFPRVRCEKALHATGNSDAEAAMNWLFAHMEDPDIDTPLDLGASGAGGSGATGGGVSQESIDTLGAMGIAAPIARKALKETSGDVNRALDWVFSHPDEQGDFGDDEQVGDAAAEPKGKDPAGSADLPARFRLKAIICHKGTSIHTGHYVAFVRKQADGEGGNKEEAWVLFNDEKVVKAYDVEEMKKFAYVYFFERV